MKLKIQILDRYIFREVFTTFLFGICAFSAVFIGSGTLFKIAKFITEYGASTSSVIKIFVFSLPGIVIWTFPMSMLLSTLISFGRLSGSSEITAMKSCGVSFYRIAAPPLLLGLAVSFFAIWFNENVVPAANSAYQRVLHYEIKQDTALSTQEHIVIKDVAHGKIERLLYARLYSSEKERMEDITLGIFTDGKLTNIEIAAYADWRGDAWLMHDGRVFDIDGAVRKRDAAFSTQLLPVKLTPDELERQQKKTEEMTAGELKEQIELLKSQFIETRKLQAELAQRYTVPMASFIFALIGVPLGLQPNRRSSSAGFAISVIIIFCYYAGMVMSSAFARGGAMPPALAVWMPNIVSFCVGAVLMKRAAK